MTITERIAYIQGVADTLDLSSGDKKDQLIRSMIDAMNDMALTISDLESELEALGAQVDEIDEDLGAVEEEFYGDMCDCDECCEEDADYAEVICPACGQEIHVDLDDLEENEPIVCPECGAKLDFELVEEEDEEDADPQ